MYVHFSIYSTYFTQLSITAMLMELLCSVLSNAGSFLLVPAGPCPSIQAGIVF